jgi:hypothetical protein
VRIAVSGSHRVGKSTLVQELVEALPQYACVEEPYHLLEEDGYEFGWPPSVSDFEAQLDRSVAEIEAAGKHVLFERCPADLFAYLLVDGHDIRAAVERSRDAMHLLDLVVFVPIEEPDRIAVRSHEDREQRGAVDEVLERLLVDEELVRDVLIVHGDVPARLAQVLARVHEPGGPPPVAGAI